MAATLITEKMLRLHSLSYTQLTSNVYTQLLESNAMPSIPRESAGMEYSGTGVYNGILVTVHNTHSILQVVTDFHILDDVVVEVNLKGYGKENKP